MNAINPRTLSSRLITRFFPAMSLAALFAFSFAANAAPAGQTNTVQTLAGLQGKLATLLAQPRFNRALWGVKIVSLDTGRTLFESHADRLMSPASNCKLFTAALALDRFGGNYRIATPIYATSKVGPSGTIKGDLVVVGRGDPTWNKRRLGTNFWSIFKPFVAVLTNAGVRRVEGDLVADATFFHGRPTGSSWMIDDFQNGDAAIISALTLDDNLAQARVTPGPAVGAPCRLAIEQPATGLVISNLAMTVSTNSSGRVRAYYPAEGNVIYVFGQLPTGSKGKTLDLPVPRPADWFAAGLKEALARQGIEVSGRTRGISWPQTANWDRATAVKLGEVLSPPLRDVVRGFIKPSQNLETDTLLDYIGETTRTPGTPSWESSERLGLSALHAFLQANDLPAGEVLFNEASGLSDDNMATANAITALLEFMARNRNARDFINALPVAGVDGTLRHRMRGTPAANNVRAKTGSLWWARSLSGYVTSAAGERLAFSLLLNRYSPPRGRNSRADLDAIAEMLAEYSGRSTNDAASLEQTFSPFGELILTQLVSAPFPHPARAKGHTYHGRFYSAKDHYSDSTVAIFVPKHFRWTGRTDFIVHFHGWYQTVATTLANYNLIGQLIDSDKNAVLVVPEGPRDAPDSFGGKLEDPNGFKRFMDEVVETLNRRGTPGRPPVAIDNIILSGHSGGYHVMAAILDHGGLSAKIREVWLFDALYGGTANFLAWQQKEQGRLVDIYTDHGGTREETERLMTTLKSKGIPFFSGEDTTATPDDLRANRLVFLHSNLAHGEVISKHDAFRRLLETSRLEDR